MVLFDIPLAEVYSVYVIERTYKSVTWDNTEKA